MAAKISVIMPVYNCEAYLEAAVDSVLSQSEDLELIAVEDCSTDGTRELLRRLAAQHPQTVRAVFNERNLGVAAVRNIALDHATGEFLAFCDSDDVVPPGAYATLLQAVGDRDVAIGAFDDVTDDGDGVLKRDPRPIEPSAKHSAFLSLFSVCCLWTKLIRTDFVRKHRLRFDTEMRIGEDVVFLAQLAACDPDYAVVDASVYWHCFHRMEEKRSLTHVYTLDAYRQHIECRRKLLKICHAVPECRDYVYLLFSNDLERYLQLLTDEREIEEAFELFRAYLKEYDYAQKPLLFRAMTGVPWDAFLQMNAEQYFAYQRGVLPRERVAAEFDCGRIGFRWILRYFKGWLRFKLTRSYR